MRHHDEEEEHHDEEGQEDPTENEEHDPTEHDDDLEGGGKGQGTAGNQVPAPRGAAGGGGSPGGADELLIPQADGPGDWERWDMGSGAPLGAACCVAVLWPAGGAALSIGR